MAEPIEIKSEDLIKRPPETVVKKENPLGWIDQIKSGIKQVKEIIDIAEQLGIKLPGGALGMPAAPAQDIKPAKAISAPNPQLAMILQVIGSKYGDMTVTQAIEQLKVEFGNKKIKDLLK